MAAAAKSAAAILDKTSNFGQLARVFVDAQQIDLLISLIWDRRDRTLRRLSAAAAFMELCDAAPNAQVNIREFRSWLFDDANPPVSFSVLDFLHVIAKRRSRPGDVDPRLLDLFLVKYRGWNDRSLSENLAALAERCEVPESLAKMFYSRRTRRDLDFRKWLGDLKSTQAVCHLLSDATRARWLLKEVEGLERMLLDRYCRDAQLSNHVDMTQARLFFNGLATSRGLVLCTFHGAFSFVLNDLMKKFMPDHYALNRLEVRRSGTSENLAGRGGAAFRAVKALMQKRALLIAPDGPYADDSTSEEIRVFGIPTRVSFSAALFAYEAQCDLGWCSLINENERLVPSYAPGPTRKSGETFARFKDRWLSFYSARLEEAFSSNPKNLALHSSRWVSFALKTKGVAKGDDHVSSNHQISSPGNAPAASNPSRAESN